MVIKRIFSNIIVGRGEESVTRLQTTMRDELTWGYIFYVATISGRFNLDPNRVLDIMLDAFEFHLEDEDFFITLLKEYSSNYDKSTVCHILGFKYQFYKVR